MRAAAYIALVAVLPLTGEQARPYHDPSRQRLAYHGPGREEPEPKGLTEVRIGYFGPDDPNHSDGGAIWRATTLAVEEANRDGGYKGLPFRLVPGWSENPWAGGVSRVVRMAYVDKVWAVIGSINGDGTHLAEQVVAKALLPLVNPASTDTSIHRASVPWMFSVIPGDHLQAPVIAEAVKRQGGKAVLLSATDHDSRAFVSDLRRSLAPTAHVEFEPGRPDGAGLAERVQSSGAASVVVVAGAGDTAEVVRRLKESAFPGAIFAGPSAGRSAALSAAEGVFLPVLAHESAALDEFRRRYRARFAAEPDFAAAHAYDAARILIEAIGRAGLNRARIRDALAALSPWPGVTGPIEWDPSGQNRRPVSLGRVVGGNTPLCGPPN